MKKSIIATSAASLALAAMPVVGVFAADAGSPSIVDNVTVVINESCTFQATANNAPVTPSGTAPGSITRNFRKDATLGATVELGGDPTQAASGSTDAYPITIEGVCNSGESGSTKTGTWTISALGANEGKMVKTGSDASDTDNIPTGTATTGTASAWAMKINQTGATGGYGNYKEVPTGTAAAVATNAANGTSFSFQPQYRVYVGTEQASGTYTGTVTYTIASTWQ